MGSSDRRPAPAGQPADAELEAVAAGVYGAFDNRGGHPPDLDRLRALFLPQAAVFRVAAGRVEAMTLDGFLAPRGRILTDGTLQDFHEWEVAAATVRTGALACQQSAYPKAGRLQGVPFEGGGRKLIQLVRTRGRWRIASLLWEDDPAPAGA